MQNTDAGTNTERLAADYSLRASGQTYVDRHNEAGRIIDRIKTSSASVIGISGVRGAGKSSLAKRVLDECDQIGFFTLLVPSPTGYEPREFLLAIFQRIAEHTSERIQAITEGAENLASLGVRRVQQVRRQLIAVGCGIVLLCGAAGAAYYGLQLDRDHLALTDFDARIQAVQSELGQRKPAANSVSGAASGKAFPPAAEEVEKADDADIIPAILNDALKGNPVDLQQFAASLKGLQSPTLTELRDQLYRKRALLTPTVNNRQVFYSIAGAIGGLLALTVVMLGFLARRLWRKYRIVTDHKLEVGLDAKCQEFLELIKFQSTLESSAELSFTQKFLAGKLTSSKQLAARPLSLPGLTANCSEFLQKVGEVFKGKVVICIDELDKITEVAQLFELLKGIKGILGQESSHFILTISEDAMVFFNERLSRDRSLIESSFEEIVYLDRLNFDLSMKVICRSLAIEKIDTAAGAEIDTASELASGAAHFCRNCSILWLFAAGIPREIKRNLFICYSNSLALADNSSLDLWRLLYLSMLELMLATSAPKEAADVIKQYKFLICIETIKKSVDELRPEKLDFKAFMLDICTVLGAHFGDEFAPLLAAVPAAKRHNGELASPLRGYLPQLVEAIIGALILGVVSGDITEQYAAPRHLDVLIYVYKYIPINPQYAFYGLKKFLELRLRKLGVSFDDLRPMPQRQARRYAAGTVQP